MRGDHKPYHAIQKIGTGVKIKAKLPVNQVAKIGNMQHKDF